MLGINLCNALVACGATVAAYGRTRTPPKSLHQDVKWISGLFDDVQDTQARRKGARICLSFNQYDDPGRFQPGRHAPDLAANVLPTVRLLEFCRKEGVKKVVFSSSGGTVYGVPLRESRFANDIVN